MQKKRLHQIFFGKPEHRSSTLAGFQKYQTDALLFLSIGTPGELCRLLEIPMSQLEHIINYPSYRAFQIPKKRGGYREILAPEEGLKELQKKLNHYLQAYYFWIKPDEVHGFVINALLTEDNCNIVANAERHTGKKAVLNIDLKDFFPRVTANRVFRLFSSEFFGFTRQMATVLALLTTYNGHLPTGAPSSPVLSNFICYQLDKELKAFSFLHGLSYSRYADDLTFSSKEHISTDLILDIINEIRKNDFAINEKKLRVRNAGRKQTVTGLTVNNKINVDRKLLKKIRAMLHDLSVNGPESAAKKHFKLNRQPSEGQKATFINRLKGYINFVRMVRGEKDPIYIKQQQLLYEVLKKNPT